MTVIVKTVDRALIVSKTAKQLVVAKGAAGPPGFPLNLMSTARILGRITAGSGAIEELTAVQAKSFLAIAQADVAGLTTADTPTFAGGALGSAAYTATTAYLAAAGTAANSSQLLSGTWAIPGTIGSTTPNTLKFTTGESTNIAALTTIAESWIGPSSTAGVYFKGGFVGYGTTNPRGKFEVRQAAGSYPALASSADWAHGVTGTTPTDIAFQHELHGSGGNILRYFSSGADFSPITLMGIHGNTAPTTAAIAFNASKRSGTTQDNLASGEIAFKFDNWGTNLVTILGSGNFGIGTTSPTAAKLVVAAGTATTDVNILNGTQTWNNAAVAFTAIKAIITDTASAAGALALQILGGAAGATNLISVSKAGLVDAPAYSVGGAAGASKGAGPVTSITVVNGIVTACS